MLTWIGIYIEDHHLMRFRGTTFHRLAFRTRRKQPAYHKRHKTNPAHLPTLHCGGSSLRPLRRSAPVLSYSCTQHSPFFVFSSSTRQRGVAGEQEERVESGVYLSFPFNSQLLAVSSHARCVGIAVGGCLRASTRDCTHPVQTPSIVVMGRC